MGQNCHIHPTRDGEWICHECGKSYCPDCVLIRSSGGYHGQGLTRMCPDCVTPVSWVGVAGSMSPFWKRMDEFFIYPFHASPLILLVGIALINAILEKIPMGGYLQIFFSAMMLNYAYLALRQTSRGDLTPPPMYDESLTTNLGPVVAQVLLFVILAAAGVFIGHKFGVALALVYAVLVMFFLPSMLIILVMDGNPVKAANPAAFMALPFRIGKGYFIMWLFLFLLMLAPGFLFSSNALRLSGFLGDFVKGAFGNYYMLVAYHLMGYVLLQYHGQLGYEVEYDDIKQADGAVVKPDDPASEAVKRTAVMFADGRHDEAIDYIHQCQARGMEFTLELSIKYFTLLKMKGETAKMLAHGPVLLDLLCRENARTKALDSYKECIRQDPQFLPGPNSLFKIAGWMGETGDAKGAINTFNRLIKAFPDNPNVPTAYFRAAQLFNDRLMNHEKAKTVLNGLLKKYPDHEIAPKVRNYLQHMGA